jgi:hypothetical protein
MFVLLRSLSKHKRHRLRLYAIGESARVERTHELYRERYNDVTVQHFHEQIVRRRNTSSVTGETIIAARGGVGC